MGKSIFIGNSDTFDVVIHYKEDGKRLKILAEPEKEIQDVDVVKEVVKDVVKDGVTTKQAVKETVKEKKEVVTSETLSLSFRYPSFSDSQQILRASTGLDANGNPSLNFMQLQTSLLYSLISTWDVKDEKGKPVEVNANNVSKLRVEIAKEIIAKVYAELGDGGLI